MKMGDLDNNNTSNITKDGVPSDALLPTKSGNFRVRVTMDEEGKEHSLLYIGLDSTNIPIVRVHSECLTGDAFESLRCDCGPQLRYSMGRIQEDKCGAIAYLRQEGRGIGLHAKIKAMALQDGGMSTLDANLALGLPADDRDYAIAAKMFLELGCKKVRLMTNNPEKVKGLQDNGIQVVERIPIVTGLCEHNRYYLETKRKRMGHLLETSQSG